MRVNAWGALVLTDDEIKNGWTEDQARKYQKSRDIAHGLVPGNVVTEYARPKPPVQVISCKDYDPLKWR